jgi:hypothetical protein
VQKKIKNHENGNNKQKRKIKTQEKPNININYRITIIKTNLCVNAVEFHTQFSKKCRQ